MKKFKALHETAIKSLDDERSIVEISSLTTLPHSAVTRITLDNNQSVILKSAGAVEFSAQIRKKLLVNRDIVSILEEKTVPRLLANYAAAEQPWMLFEDLSEAHQSSPYGAAPPYRYITMFVRALAKSHAYSASINLHQAFEEVPGDVQITDGSESVPGMLAEFLADCDPERFPSKTYELLGKIRDYVKTSAECGIDLSEAEVLERYRQCLLLTVVVATAMKRVPGMSDLVWSFMFTNAVHSAIEHDALEFLG